MRSAGSPAPFSFPTRARIRARRQRLLPRMHIAVAHRVHDAIDALPEVIGAAPQQTTHVVHFLPIPPALLLVFSELPHGAAPVTLPGSLHFRRWSRGRSTREMQGVYRFAPRTL